MPTPAGARSTRGSPRSSSSTARPSTTACGNGNRAISRTTVSVLAVDLPGHGRSPGAMRATIEEWARWVASFLDAAGIGKANLVGHSMGSLIALEATLRSRSASRSSRSSEPLRRCPWGTLFRGRPRRFARGLRHGSGMGALAPIAAFAERRSRHDAPRCEPQAERARQARRARRGARGVQRLPGREGSAQRARRADPGRRRPARPDDGVQGGQGARERDPRRAFRGARRRPLDDERGAARATAPALRDFLL